MKTVADKVLAIVPEGPVAHDGERYRYSKGERKYIEDLAPHFKEVVIVSFVFRPGDVYYEACSHSAFTAPNIRFVELPRSATDPNVLEKVWQFLRVFLVMSRVVPRVDLLYLFLPGYPSAMAWVVGRIFRRKHFVYAADDWVQATPGMFKWEHLRSSPVYRFFGTCNRFLERAIASSALFSVTAGQALLIKYRAFGRPVVETTPRMVLSAADVHARNDTCDGSLVRLINVGSLAYDKAQHELLKAFALVRSRLPQRLQLDIVGEGPLRDELERVVRELDLAGDVRFHGHVQQESALYDLYRRADVFVLSSVSEGFPRVLYEAMAMHLPIVTTGVGGIQQLMVNGVNALVVPPSDSSALADAIVDVVQDGALRRALIQGGARTIAAVFERMDPRQIPKLLAETM